MVLTTDTLNEAKSAVISVLNSQQTHIAISTDTSTPSESDSSLGGTELIEAVYSESNSSSSITKSMFIDATEFNGNTISKAGLYDAISGGNLLSSSLTNSINKTSSMEVYLEFVTNIDVVNN